MSLPARLYSAALYRLSSLFTWKGLTRFLEREYARIPPGARVLSVGAGGRFNELLYPHARGRPFAVTSLDIDAARRPDVVGDLCASPFRPGSFGAIVMGEVLEHVQAPQQAIESVHRLLRADGALILTTPFLFPIHDRPRDYFRFTRYGLELLLRDFREVSITPRASWAESINALGVRLALEPSLGARLLAPIAVLAAFVAAPVAWLLGKLVDTDFVTIGYLVTARK
jgi:SAM-dependent methyltransferase